MSSTSVGTAKSDVPMKTRRRLTLASARLFQTLGLCELLERHRALEARKMIDEQHAFEVIDFVLQAGGEESLRLEQLQPPLAIEIFGPDLCRAFDLFPDIRNRETAFLANRSLVRCPDDLRIDEYARFLLAVLARQVHHQDALGDADLDRGEPYPFRR